MANHNTSTWFAQWSQHIPFFTASIDSEVNMHVYNLCGVPLDDPNHPLMATYMYHCKERYYIPQCWLKWLGTPLYAWRREYIPRSSGHWHWLRRRGMWVPIVIIVHKIKVVWWDKRREGQSEVSECSDKLYSRIARDDHECTLEWLDCDQRGPRVSTLMKQERVTTNQKTRAR